MIIRPAKQEDARAIAKYIAMAESEMVAFFFGTDNQREIIDGLEELVLSPIPNRYSLSVNTVLEEDGKAAGSIISFAADSQRELDKPLLAVLKKQGIALGELTQEGAPGTWYGSTMGVNPEYRGRGFGSLLLRGAVQAGRDKGFEQTTLLVARAKPKVKGLYERLGFRVLEEVRIADVVYDRMIGEASDIL